MFPIGICRAHGSHKQAENGTFIVSPGLPMALDAMHLLTCVKITSDTHIRVHLSINIHHHTD